MKPQNTRESNLRGVGVMYLQISSSSRAALAARRSIHFGLPRFARSDAFTLIELSIVLVIIGLIVGGVLVGQDLIKAAELRSQVSQIEKYNIATQTFKLKYNGLPGDIRNAIQFGFAARGSLEGQGDGNGLIAGNCNNGGAAPHRGVQQGTGETAIFWRDLSDSQLIAETFNTASSVTPIGADISNTNVPLYLPRAKINRSGYVAVFSENGLNRFALQNITGIRTNGGVLGLPSNSDAALTVSQAYNIDVKIDDGAPQYGNVLAEGLANDGVITIWAGPNGPNLSNTPYTTAQATNSAMCFDNGNTASVEQRYSLSNNANENNCTISIRAGF